MSAGSFERISLHDRSIDQTLIQNPDGSKYTGVSQQWNRDTVQYADINSILLNCIIAEFAPCEGRDIGFFDDQNQFYLF